MAETAADMPQSYQTFKNDAQEIPDKTARHRLAADLLPEIWASVRPVTLDQSEVHIGAMSIDNITLSDGEVRENAHRAAVRRGSRIHPGAFRAAHMWLFCGLGGVNAESYSSYSSRCRIHMYL